MEAQGDPLKGSLPTLQTSLTHPELPQRAPAYAVRRFGSLCFGRVLLGEVFCRFGRQSVFAKCGFALDWGVEDLSALIRRLRRHLPPRRGRLLCERFL